MRKPRLSVLLAAVLIAGSLWPALASDKNDVNDIGNRRVAHRSIISQEKEIAIGKEISTEIDHQAKLVTDPVINEYVNRVAQNVARNSDLKIPLTVKVIDDPTINAFTLPGGFIYVNSGTLQAADEEDQLAGVIAHEIGHAAARHWAQQMTRATILQYAMLPVMFTPMSIGTYYGVEAAMNGIPIAFLKFNRSAEAEADELGLQYMYKAGYDPTSFVDFFERVRLMEKKNSGILNRVFSPHPMTNSRIKAAQKEIQQILVPKTEYVVNTSEFNDVKDRLTRLQEHRRLQADNDWSRPRLRQRPGMVLDGSMRQ